MKLYKQPITPEDIPSEPHLITDAGDRDALKREAEALAKRDYGMVEFAWTFTDADRGYTELTVDGECRYVVRP
jgi:hypothetical protein